MSLYKRVFNKICRIYSYYINKFQYGLYGKNTIIQKPLLITNKKYIYLGNCVSIKPLSRIEPVIGWGKEIYNPKLVIEDNVTIEQGLHINCAESVIIHKDCLISSYVYISDIEHEYRDVKIPVLEQPLLVAPTEIGDQTFIGTGVKILAGSHIGKHCIIGANSIVTHDIPDFSIAVGVPARIIKRYDFVLNKWVKV